MHISRIKELMRGKSFGRAAMNVLLSEQLKDCRGQWLDIGGGGTPSYLAYLSNECIRTATDLSPNDGVVAMDANGTFPFPDADFDGVFAFNMLYIVCDPMRTLEEVRRVVKPGGLLYATFPFFFSEHPEPHDYHRWTREGVELLLSRVGFEDIQIMPVGGAGTAFAMSFMPGRGLRIIRLLAAPFIFLWDQLNKEQGPVCFWLVSARVPQV